MNRSDYYMEKEKQFGATTYVPLPLVISKAEGIWVEDPEGNRYMDFLSAYSSVNQGHRHPKIIAALKDQADKVTITSRAFHSEPLGVFFEKLAAYTQKELILPMNSGAEAVETAVKAARRWGYQKKMIADNRAEIIVAKGNFHGRTTTAISMSADLGYRKEFGPFTPGFKWVEYGNLEALKDALTSETAAILLEPIQGEAGIVIPPDGYLRSVSELCQQQQILFIADEIQTGFGRTGQRFACDWESVVPDLYILGKALGGGVIPISAVAGNKDVLGVFDPGSHGSTFGGNPLAAAVGIAALEVLEDEQLAARSRELGKYLLTELEKIESPLVKNIRGRGLFVAVELHVPARKYCERLKDRGVLCKETHETIIRLAPPLIIQQENIDWAVQQIKQVLG